MDDLKPTYHANAPFGDLDAMADKMVMIAGLIRPDGCVTVQMLPADARAVARIIKTRDRVRVVEVPCDLPLSKSTQLYFVWMLGFLTYSALEPVTFPILRSLGLMP